MKHFLINRYETIGTFLNVVIERFDFEIPIKIPTDKFEQFLNHEGKLDWIIDTNDHTGEHLQFSGTMDMEEYWLNDRRIIEKDLYQYITMNPITYRGKVLTNSLAQIMLIFYNANANRTRPQNISISSCCSAPNTLIESEDVDFLHYGICPVCKEHCEFEEPINGAFAD